MARPDNDRKARQNEDLDFLSFSEQRKHRRVQSNAFGGIALTLTPAPPFFGDPVEGTLVDLSGGGLAVRVPEMVPTATRLRLSIKFSFRPAVTCTVSVRRAVPAGKAYLLGLQFLDLSGALADELVRMSADYDACDHRIREDQTPTCLRSCAFFRYCDKAQKAA